jgi:exopolyphosphatase/guanosine-5'-triphosphate,3'-diphosphate pyrophosphatase
METDPVVSKQKSTPRPAVAATATNPVAVIDIGASAIRLRIAEIGVNNDVRTLESLQQAVQLGKDTFTTGRIQTETVEECVKILKGFRRIMTEYGVTRPDQVRAVATSAVREAENRESVLDRLYMATQINVEAIEGAEENRLTYIAIQDALKGEKRLKKGSAIIVDIGGGSTELLLLEDGCVTFAHSYRTGALRIRETLETYRAPSNRVRAVLDQHIRRVVDQLHHTVPVKQVEAMVAVSDDAQFAASLLSHSWASERMVSLELKSFCGLADKLATVPVDDLVRQYRIPYQEGETLGAALLVYEQLARVFGVKDILVPKASLRDGLIEEMVAGNAWTEEFAVQAVYSAVTLGKKYAFDRRHAEHVAELSAQLFRALQAEHSLGQRYELLLRIAALLHEIGNYVSDRSHHKHSMYLILNSDLFGLRRKDIALIALVARYHRRAAPQSYHEEYQTLDRDSRIAVAKLAAILRVADALERSHLPGRREVSFARDKDQFVITVHDAQDLTLERLALKEKGSMFEEVFGLPVVLRAARATKSESIHG